MDVIIFVLAANALALLIALGIMCFNSRLTQRVKITIERPSEDE